MRNWQGTCSGSRGRVWIHTCENAFHLSMLPGMEESLWFQSGQHFFKFFLTIREPTSMSVLITTCMLWLTPNNSTYLFSPSVSRTVLKTAHPPELTQGSAPIHQCRKKRQQDAAFRPMLLDGSTAYKKQQETDTLVGIFFFPDLAFRPPSNTFFFI